MTQRLAGELCQLGHPSQTCYLCFKTKECKSLAPYEWAGELSSAAAIWWPLKGSPGHICHKLHWPWAATTKCWLRATLPSNRVPQLPVSLCLGSTSCAGLRLTNLFCRLWWERLLPWSYLPAHKQFRRDWLYGAVCVVTEHRSPSNMAVTDFVEEIRSVGKRLLLKLQGLPQAEPVELVAFSIIILFTGKWGSWSLAF